QYNIAFLKFQAVGLFFLVHQHCHFRPFRSICKGNTRPLALPAIRNHMRSAGTVDKPVAIEFFLFLQQFFDSVLGNIIRIHCYRDGNKLVGSKGKSTLFDLLGGLNLLVDILISEFCHLSFGIGLGNTLDARSPWLLPVTIEESSGPYRYGRQKEERKKHQTDLFHEVSEQKLISRNTLRPNLIPVKQG